MNHKRTQESATMGHPHCKNVICEFKICIWVLGHVSSLARGHEDIRKHDTQCVCHSQRCRCSAVTSWARLSMATFYSFNVTAAIRHRSVCAKSSQSHLLPLREEHLQPGCCFPTCSGHPPVDVITEDIRLHSQ